MNDIFPIRLKSLRKSLDRTQEDIAKILNVRRSTYGEYERGKIVPPVDKMKILADYFCVSVDYLMGNTNLKTHHERNEKKPYDISYQLKIMLDNLHDNKSALTIDGKLIDEESREVLTASLESSLKMVQMISKRREDDRTPRKTETIVGN